MNLLLYLMNPLSGLRPFSTDIQIKVHLLCSIREFNQASRFRIQITQQFWIALLSWIHRINNWVRCRVTFRLACCNELYAALEDNLEIAIVAKSLSFCMLLGKQRFHNSSVTGVAFISNYYLGPVQVLIIWKILNSLGPGYLKNHLALQMSALILRSDSKGLLCIPPMSESRTRKMVFSVVYP